jgi:hypothetical protein
MAKPYHGADTAIITEALRKLAPGSAEATAALAEWEKLPFVKMHSGEPWFFLRGRDELAPRSLDFYAGLLRNKSLDGAADEVDALTSAMVSWQIRVPDVVRLPD